MTYIPDTNICIYIINQKPPIILAKFQSIPLEIFNFDYSAALEYGIIRSNLEKKGTPIGSLDMLIAAHAKSMDFIVITNNEKEFSRVEGLRIENWIKG